MLVWHKIEKLLYILKILQSLLVLFIFTTNSNKKKGSIETVRQLRSSIKILNSVKVNQLYLFSQLLHPFFNSKIFLIKCKINICKL